MEKKVITSFRDLIVWQKARELVIETYLLTKHFPKEEQFSLTSQIRRASTSVTANIAEGFGRSTFKDREHFYVMAQGSLYELDSHMQIAFDLGYISQKGYKNFGTNWEGVSRLLSAFIKAHRNRSSNL